VSFLGQGKQITFIYARLGLAFISRFL